MPLIPSKSKKAFDQNLNTEIHDGTPQKQALAIAYSVKRKPKKLARGGMVNDSAATEQRPMPEEEDKDAKMASQNDHMEPMSKKPSIVRMKHSRMVEGVLSARPRDEVSMHKAEEDKVEHPAAETEDNDMLRPEGFMDNRDPAAYADGGMVSEEDQQPEEETEEEKHSSIAAAIMARRAKQYADGGMVDLEENAEEEPNDFDEANHAILKENYDSDIEDMHQPEDSNEHGDEHEMSEENDHDMIAAIRRKMRIKSPMVR